MKTTSKALIILWVLFYIHRFVFIVKYSLNKTKLVLEVFKSVMVSK